MSASRHSRLEMLVSTDFPGFTLWPMSEHSMSALAAYDLLSIASNALAIMAIADNHPYSSTAEGLEQSAAP